MSEVRPKRPRRTHAERSAETRGRVIAAAIESLFELGYAATSTTIVANRAKVSRGAMTYHFPTKVDMIGGVVEHVYRADVAGYEAFLETLSPGREQFLGLTDEAWRAVSSPGGIAVLHILIATPGDPELKAKLPEVLNRISSRAHTSNLARARAAGIGDAALMDAASLLHMATLRGLAIEQISGNSAENIQAALALFRRYREYFADVLGPMGGKAIADVRSPLPKS